VAESYQGKKLMNTEQSRSNQFFLFFCSAFFGRKEKKQKFLPASLKSPNNSFKKIPVTE
jgi:hypothetical protein